jgi:hypothetical protein
MRTTDDELLPIDPIPTSDIPHARREACADARASRGIAMSRAISCATLSCLCLAFAGLYASFSRYFWSGGACPTAGVVFSILSGVTLAGAVAMAYRLNEEVAAAPSVPPRLARDAEIEEAIEDAAASVNRRAAAWNESVRRAASDGLVAARLQLVRERRAEIDRRRSEVAAAIRRYRSAIGEDRSVSP